jgi:hypothetical protein
MPYSLPVRVIIPAIGVRARIVPLGENSDGTAGVPSLSQPAEVGWFDRWPAPGQRGPAVLYGHVNIAQTGPAVFYRLGNLRPGEIVAIARADHQTAIFRIDTVAMYAKTAFPARLVYGRTAGPQLRLITCGGPFDPATGSYLDNTIAFAHLIAASGRRPR